MLITNLVIAIVLEHLEDYPAQMATERTDSRLMTITLVALFLVLALASGHLLAVPIEPGHHCAFGGGINGTQNDRVYLCWHVERHDRLENAPWR